MRRLLLAAAAAICASAPAFAAPAAAAPAPAPLAQAIMAFADYKSFAAKPEDIDAVLAPHCKKLRSMDDADGVFYEYSCNTESGLKSAQVTFMRAARAALYLQTLHVVYGNAYYDEFRRKVGDKLGKPALASRDQVSWSNAKDRKADARGTPTITMTRDRDEKLTSFDVSLEQGL